MKKCRISRSTSSRWCGASPRSSRWCSVPTTRSCSTGSRKSDGAPNRAAVARRRSCNCAISTRGKMKLTTTLLALGIAVASTTLADAATTFRFAFQGDLKSLDPYSLNETFTHGVLGNVFEGLTKRGPNLEIMPGLAERWEILEPTHWRFHLRKGVRFQNGEEFTADDVIFSADRGRALG